MLSCRRRRLADPPSLRPCSADRAAVMAGAGHRQIRDHAPGGAGRGACRFWLVSCLGLVDFALAGHRRYQLLAACAAAIDRHSVDPGVLLGAGGGVGTPAGPWHRGEARLAAAVPGPLRVGAWPYRYRLPLECAGIPVFRKPAAAAVGKPCRALRPDTSGAGRRVRTGILDCRAQEAGNLFCRSPARAGSLWVEPLGRNPAAARAFEACAPCPAGGPAA